MTSTPLLENIGHQPQALHSVAAHQLGAGRRSLLAAADLLGNAKRIVLSGMGASFFALTPLAYELTAAGVPVTVLESSELLHYLPAAIDAGSVVVLVSRSGESVEVIKLLPELERRGAAVIGVVNVPGSTLDRQARVSLQLESPADQLVAIQTYAGTMATLGLLAAARAGYLENAARELEHASDVLGDWIPDSIAARGDLDGFLGGNPPLYVLGRGPSLGTVAEGALLFHETAKWPAVGMSSAQFRHGPVEVVDRSFRSVIIGTQSATMQLDAALASDLRSMGGEVRWIGPEQANAVPALLPWPAGVAARFLPLLEIVPLQIAAYRRAELSGMRPGDFRWAPAVTTSESGFSLPVAG